MSVPTVNLGSDATPLSTPLPAPSRRSMSPRARGRSVRTAPSTVRTAPSMRATPEEMAAYATPSPRRSVNGMVQTNPQQVKPSDNELLSCNPCGDADSCHSSTKSSSGGGAPAGGAMSTNNNGCYTRHLSNAWFWGFLIAAIIAVIIIWIFAANGWSRVTNNAEGSWLWGIIGIILLVLFAIAAYQAWNWGNRNQRIMIGIAFLLALVLAVVLYGIFFSGQGSGDGLTLTAFWLSLALLAVLIWMLWLVWGHAFATWIVVLLLIFVVIQTIWLWSVYAN